MNTQIFNSIARLFLLPIFLVLLQINATLEAQTRIFRGTESALWDNPLNWEPFGLLPVATEDIVIDPTGPHTDVIMNIDVDIRSLHVKSGTLTVPVGNTLTVSNSSSGLDGVKVTTGFINLGTINIPNAGGNGVSVDGIFNNMSNLNIGQNSGSIGVDGINVTNSLINSGTINVSNTVENGVTISGSFKNTANLSIGQNEGVGLQGFLIQGASGHLNNDGGTVTIDNTGVGSNNKNGIRNEGGLLTNQNSGNIQIGQNDGMISGKGLVGSGSGTTFINDGSVIRIDHTGTNDPSGAGSAIWLVNAVMFENKGGGQILLGQNGGHIGRDGITIGLANCVFKNTDGVVSIDNTGANSTNFGRGLDIGAGGTFLNEAAGQVLIGQNDGQIKESGIAVSNATAVFTNNGGLVQIDNTGVNSVNGSSAAISLVGTASPQFTNKNDGQIFIGQTDGNLDGRAFSNNGVVSNEGCNSGIFIFSNDVIVNSSSFVNEGVIVEFASGNSTISSNTGIVKNYFGGTFSVGSGNPAININFGDPIDDFNTFIWQGCISSDWSDPQNWHLGLAPNPFGRVFIYNSPNDPVLNSEVIITSLRIGSNAQLTIQNDGSLTLFKATSVSIQNDGTILNHGELTIFPDLASTADAFHNTGVFTNVNCAKWTSIGPLNNEGFILNNGFISFSTDQPHSNTGTFINNGLFQQFSEMPIPSITNNEIIINPTTANACADISPAFDLGETLNFNFVNIYTDPGQTTSAGSFDATTNTFSPDPPLEEGEHLFFVEVYDPLGGCTEVVPWQLTTQNCCDLPEAACQPYEAILDGNGQVSITVADVDGGTTADCGLESLSIDLEDFDCSHVGTPQTVTLTVTDINGDSDQCTAEVTTVDLMAPTLDCPSAETVNTDPGICQATFAVPEPTANDNCAVTILQYRHRLVDEMGNDLPGIGWSSWTTATTANLELGQHKIQWQAKDASGNQEKCNFLVEVVDNEPPSPVCLQPVIEFNGETEIFLEIDQVWDEASSSDNCGPVYFIEMSPEKVSCEQLGTIVPVTITVEDANGNINECIANVTVGGLPCGFSAPENGINCNDSNHATYDVGTEDFTLSSEGCYDPSYYRATDAHGYVGTNICGDAEVIAHIAQVEGTGWAGITMREGLGASDKMLQLMVDGVSMSRRELRQSTGAIAFAHQFPTQGKNWLRLTRSGNTFGAYHSVDGINWQAVLITNIPMTSCIEVGMITMNSSPNGTTTGTFEDFEVKAPSALHAPATAGIDIAETVVPTLEVYPNPAKGEAWLRFDRLTGQFDRLIDQVTTIEIYNNLGQLMHQVSAEEMQTQRIRLDVEGWNSGMYLIQVKTKGQPVLSKKLIVSD